MLSHSANSVIPVAGFPVVSTTSGNLTDYLLTHIVNGKKTALLFANANFVVRCRHLLNLMKREDVTIVNDGIGLDIAARFIAYRVFNENLPGTDFVPYFLSNSLRPLRIFMLGSKPHVLDAAARHVQEVLHQKVVGMCDGYDGMANTADLIQRINDSGAEVVMVAMGNPLQEEWILKNLDDLRVNIVIGVGALFDFWSGNVPRAPHLMRRFRLEWLFRLCIEPRRLLARYTVDFVKFLLLCRKFR